MTATDRLRQAAQTIRDAAQPLADAMARGAVLPARLVQEMEDALTRCGFTSPHLALLIADWLEDIAADKDSGLGSIHPRALDVTNLILGGDQ